MRPRIKIIKDDFERLCGLFCTLDDVSGWFKCSPDTIERWVKRTYKETFADILKRYSSSAKVSLRRKQLELANRGSVPLLIWLGKQHLNQKDKHELSTDDVRPFTLAYTISDLRMDNDEPTDV